MNEIFGISGSYQERCTQLCDNKLALWDVLRASVRPGSLDANIRRETAQANDFDTFLSVHTKIELIAFNGKKAEQLFRTMVYKQQYENMMLVSLPSTSPAYAAMSFRGKLDAWREGLALNPV